MKNTKEKLSKQEKQEQQINRYDTFKWFLRANYENIWFILLNVLFVAIITTTISLSICDTKYFCIKWDTNAIGVLCQIITAIISFIASTIGIAITLLKEECWGVSVKEFNNLRVGLRYPIVIFIILAILLSALNIAFYIAHLVIASIGVAIVAILFCIYVAWCEIPLMVKSERFLIKTVRKRLWREWKSPQDLPKDLKAVLKYLITNHKTLKDTYELLKSKNKIFNKFLILKLLEIQSDAAFELAQIESKQQQIDCAGSLFDNVQDIISFNLDLSGILEEHFLSYEHYITRVLFRLKELLEYRSRATSLIADSLIFLKYNKFSEDKFEKEKVQFILSTVLSMVTLSIRDGDFCFVKALQERFSISYYDLGHDNYESIVFALVSMQFYFLCNDSENASIALKEAIAQYLDYSDIVNHTKIYSWKNLYTHFSHEFKINFEKFMKYFSISEKSWDVPRYFEAQWVQLDRGYALRWYLIHVLNSYQVRDFDYSTLCLDEHCKFYIKDLGERCFDENKKFIVLDKMKSILEFYGVGEEPFQYFRAFEERSNNLFNFINGLRKADLFTESVQAISKENGKIADGYKKVVLDAVQSEWGFDSSIEITSSPKAMAILIEKASRATNYEEVMGDTIIKSLFHELKLNASPKTISRSGNLDKDIGAVLRDDFAFISKSMERIGYFIKSDSLKQQFEKLCSKANRFESRILYGYILVKDGGFSFNLEFTEFSVRDLTVEELSEEVESFKRADGQYVYEGTFLSREEIEHLVSQKYAVLRIAVRYQIQTFEDAVVEIKPH